MMALWNSIVSFGVAGLLQVIVLAFVFYYIFIFFRGTRGAQVLVGLTILLLFFIGATQLMQWVELNWLLRKLSVGLAVALLVIFQPEIRRALAELGETAGVSHIGGKTFGNRSSGSGS